LDLLNQLKELNSLTNLSKLEDLSELSQLSQLQELQSLSKLSDLNQLDNLKELSNLQNLSKLDQLSSLNHLDQLALLDKLNALTELNQLDKLKVFGDTLEKEGYKLDRLQQLDKLDHLLKLEELGQLVQLDKLKHLEVLSNLQKLERIDGLQDLKFLSELTKLKDLSNLEKLNKLEDLEKLDQLENLAELQKIELLHKLIKEPAWKILDKLDKLELLSTHRKTLYTSVLASFFLETLKIIIVSGLILFFVLTQVNNSQMNKLFGYLSLSNASGINFSLPLLEKTGNALDLDKTYEYVVQKTKAETRKYWSTSENFNLDSRLDSLAFVYSLDYKQNERDLSVASLDFFKEVLGLVESRFNQDTENLAVAHKDEPEKLAFIKQANYMYYNARCRDAYNLAKMTPFQSDFSEYIRMTQSLSVYCLFKEQSFDREKVLKELASLK